MLREIDEMDAEDLSLDGDAFHGVVDTRSNPNHDNHGRRAQGSSTGDILHAATRDASTKKWMINGIEAPPHVQKLGIPPAWSNVHLNVPNDASQHRRD